MFMHVRIYILYIYRHNYVHSALVVRACGSGLPTERPYEIVRHIQMWRICPIDQIKKRKRITPLTRLCYYGYIAHLAQS